MDWRRAVSASSSAALAICEIAPSSGGVGGPPVGPGGGGAGLPGVLPVVGDVVQPTHNALSTTAARRLRTRCFTIPPDGREGRPVRPGSYLSDRPEAARGNRG